VDDDHSTQILVAQIVKSLGSFEIISCSSASEAVKKLEIWQPDVVLSDFMMDQGDGIDLLNRVREEFGDSIPFIFITSVNFELIRPLISNEIEINIISKPLHIQHLKTMFKKLNIDLYPDKKMAI
jgi:CheY-like chemotaxis protein